MNNAKPFVCSICQREVTDEWGNNPAPICEGRCCDECDLSIVLPARIRRLNREKIRGL